MKIASFSASVGLLAVVLAALPAHATEYWTTSDLLTDFFKGSKRVSFTKVTLPDADVAAIGKKLGVDLKSKTWTIRFGLDENQNRTGYAILDDEIGLHEPIDFGVLFNLGGTIQRLEIRAYREPYGDAVRGERFRRKFVGKTANDPFIAGKDVDIVSGATYSSRAMALGVKRDALVLQAALKNGL